MRLNPLSAPAHLFCIDSAHPTWSPGISLAEVATSSIPFKVVEVLAARGKQTTALKIWDACGWTDATNPEVSLHRTLVAIAIMLDCGRPAKALAEAIHSFSIQYTPRASPSQHFTAACRPITLDKIALPKIALVAASQVWVSYSFIIPPELGNSASLSNSTAGLEHYVAHEYLACHAWASSIRIAVPLCAVPNTPSNRVSYWLSFVLSLSASATALHCLSAGS